jgi:chorismate dehydratase
MVPTPVEKGVGASQLGLFEYRSRISRRQKTATDSDGVRLRLSPPPACGWAYGGFHGGLKLGKPTRTLAGGSSDDPGDDMSRRVRVGAVNYLNTKPLIHDLERIAPEVELSLEVPSRLADRLAAAELDVALIPVVEYFRAGTYTVVPDVAIASRGPVLSVTLFSRRPWQEIRSVALDEGSRTSAALAQILLRQRYGVRPELAPLPLDHDAETAPTDAVLLIGDRAMRACLPGFEFAYDLGQEWHDWTGLPFVYAFWAVRPGVELGGVALALRRAKEHGLRRVGEIAEREAPRLGLDAGFCRRYLQTIIQFDLGPRERAGLLHYYGLACDLGLARRGVTLDFHAPADLVESR